MLDKKYCAALKLKKQSSIVDLKAAKQLMQDDTHLGDDDLLVSYAAIGDLEMVKYLVKSGANVFHRNRLALHTALEKGHEQIVEYLLTKF